MDLSFTYMDAWKEVSVDEQTIGFQGNHKDKKRIVYKAEGDCFQADTLCQDSFTFQFHYRNEPAQPWDYLQKGPVTSTLMGHGTC